MGLLRGLSPIVAIVGLVASAAALVVSSFCSCAMAEIVSWVSARLYVGGNDPETLADKREEWSRHLQDMGPLERPIHAGSLAWSGTLQAAKRLSAPSPAITSRSSPQLVSPMSMHFFVVTEHEARLYARVGGFGVGDGGLVLVAEDGNPLPPALEAKWRAKLESELDYDRAAES